jgi:alpha-tubulin suppressor-like RCC1 family protein
MKVVDPTDGPVTWASVDAGYDFTCGLTTDKEAYCWGTNDRSQLGDGSGINQSVPVSVADPASGPVEWVSISTGAFHACGMTNDGEGYCWGEGGNGQLGSGLGGTFAWPSSAIPIRIANPESGPVEWALLSTGPIAIVTCGASTLGDGYWWGMATNDFGIPVLESNVPVRLEDPF